LYQPPVKRGDYAFEFPIRFDHFVVDGHSLGIKQLQEDPWTNVSTRYHVGDIVTGEVISVTEFGVFLSLEEGIEGLIHISELSTKKVDSPADVAKVRDKLTAEIINIATKDRRIRLSVKSIESSSEKAEYAAYVAKQGETRSQLGDLIAAATDVELNGKDEPPAEEAAPADSPEVPEEEVEKPVEADQAHEEEAEEPKDSEKEEPSPAQVETDEKEVAEKPADEETDTPKEESDEEKPDEG